MHDVTFPTSISTPFHASIADQVQHAQPNSAAISESLRNHVAFSGEDWTRFNPRRAPRHRRGGSISVDLAPEFPDSPCEASIAARVMIARRAWEESSRLEADALSLGRADGEQLLLFEAKLAHVNPGHADSTPSRASNAPFKFIAATADKAVDDAGGYVSDLPLLELPSRSSSPTPNERLLSRAPACTGRHEVRVCRQCVCIYMHLDVCVGMGAPVPSPVPACILCCVSTAQMWVMCHECYLGNRQLL